jgi:hypothetical protein
MKLVQEVYASWCAEVVFVTSNFQGNKEIMEGCKMAEIPAFVRSIPPSRLRKMTFSHRVFPGNSMGFLTLSVPKSIWDSSSCAFADQKA